MIDGQLMDDIREAAEKGKTSLHEEKVCKTCDGAGWISVQLPPTIGCCNIAEAMGSQWGKT